MSVRGDQPALYNIPAGVPFADALAGELLKRDSGDHLALARVRIFLPTRRACRTLRDSFLRLSAGKPLLLPSIQPLGDIDEEELVIHVGDTDGAGLIEDIPPPLSPLRRQIMLVKLIMAADHFQAGPEQAVAIAGALAQLMDHIYTEGLDFSALPNLVEEEELAAHWQVSVKFLEILSKSWPRILEEQGLIDAADRRIRLIEVLSHYWQKQPPQTPVIAAGTTGSIPATARLLKVIAGLPQGMVILPGLDQDMDEKSWECLDDNHPQATLAHLLNNLGVTRDQVKIWDGGTQPAGNIPQTLAAPDLAMRRRLAGEMMRPAQTSAAWQYIAGTLTGTDKDKGALEETLKDIHYYECETAQEEALTIACAFRETLEAGGHTAALVTPDRALARRVAMACRRWGITLDDSGGQCLNETGAGCYLRLVLDCLISGLKPGTLMALLKHQLSRAKPNLCICLEKDYLRGPPPRGGFEGLYDHLQKLEAAENVVEFIHGLEKAFSPLTALCDNQYHDFRDFLHAHIEAAEKLGAADKLWRGEAGEKAAEFLATLNEHADLMPRMRASDYRAVLEEMMAAVTVRPAYGAHPRLFILGQLEARMMQADLVILAGLNEGVWPPEPAADPWMSRPMRKKFGLPSPERSIGLSAHDFVQGFCNKRVILTRARRREGAPTVPARWLQRLQTVLTALGRDLSSIQQGPHLSYARQLEKLQEKPRPYERPKPCPPVDKRPSGLSVTAIERWMRDPYSIYARYVLGLRKLPDLEEQADAAQRGTVLHDILAAFIRQHQERLPEDAEGELLALGREMLAENITEPALWSFWWPRFCRLARWFIDHERTWRGQAAPRILEQEGKAALTLPGGGTFTLFARADRIDRMLDGSAAVIDYKTGAPPKMTDVKYGFAPQLALEGVIVQEGGFADFQSDHIGYLGFWQMTGGPVPGEDKAVTKTDLDELCAQAREGVIALAALYEDERTPYYSLPRPDMAPPAHWQDYEHLARVQEWAALDEQEEAA